MHRIFLGKSSFYSSAQLISGERIFTNVCFFSEFWLNFFPLVSAWTSFDKIQELFPAFVFFLLHLLILLLLPFIGYFVEIYSHNEMLTMNDDFLAAIHC